MSDISVLNNLIPIEQQPFEIVERKGIGHPDTIADGIAESISNAYSKYCLEKFGVILHHNVDKISVIGGACEVDYGKGKLEKPIKLILNGRMSKCFREEKIDIERIQATAAKKYLQRVLPRLDIDKWLEICSFVASSSRIPYWFSPRSKEDLPEQRNPHANDTATVVGFWPLSATEKIVLESEKFFYGSDFAPKFDFVGHDIKIMATRRHQNLDLIMCIPFFADKVKNSQIYFEYKSFIQKEILEYLKEKFGTNVRIELYINTQDQRIKKEDNAKGRYLAVTGSALDYGEEGVTGRGNRSRGLISCIRPSSVESIYGKNPMYFVGKVYTHIVNFLSKEIATQLQCEANIIITTRNGDPLYSPYSIIVNTSEKRRKEDIRKIIIKQLKERNWSEEIIMDEVFLPTKELNYEK